MPWLLIFHRESQLCFKVIFQKITGLKKCFEQTMMNWFWWPQLILANLNYKQNYKQLLGWLLWARAFFTHLLMVEHATIFWILARTSKRPRKYDWVIRTFDNTNFWRKVKIVRVIECFLFWQTQNRNIWDERCMVIYGKNGLTSHCVCLAIT